jgi:hypothetical protein
MKFPSKFTNADQFRSFILDVSRHALTIRGMLRQPVLNNTRIKSYRCFAVCPGVL